MAKVLREDCGCDRVQVEPFKENPGSFFGWIYFTITAALLAIACYFFFPLASIILLLVGLFICFMQFGLYKKLVDPVFPEKTGHNVTAVKSCKGEVKRRIFINGHPDAAWEWPVNYKLGGVGFPLEPETVFIPFQQHIGKPAVPVKAVGDPVSKGELRQNSRATPPPWPAADSYD